MSHRLFSPVTVPLASVPLLADSCVKLPHLHLFFTRTLEAALWGRCSLRHSRMSCLASNIVAPIQCLWSSCPRLARQTNEGPPTLLGDNPPRMIASGQCSSQPWWPAAGRAPPQSSPCATPPRQTACLPKIPPALCASASPARVRAHSGWAKDSPPLSLGCRRPTSTRLRLEKARSNSSVAAVSTRPPPPRSTKSSVAAAALKGAQSEVIRAV